MVVIASYRPDFEGRTITLDSAAFFFAPAGELELPPPAVRDALDGC